MWRIWKSWKQRFHQFVAKHSTQRKRRVAVLVYYFSIVLILTTLGTGIIEAVTFYKGSFHIFLELAFFAVLVGLGITIYISLSFILASVQMGDSQRDEDLDERQQMVRDRAHRSAFRILAFLFVYVALYIGIVHPWLVSQWLWLEASVDLSATGGW